MATRELGETVSQTVRDASSAWLRRYRAAGTARPAVRLVCFPHAGGAASFYREWAELLPDGVELLAVCYPGREDRFGEACADRMADLADPVAEALAADGADGADGESRVALFGHSMGAAVASEVAVRLEAYGGVRLERLFVSGREAPHIDSAARGVHLRDDDGLAAEVTRLGGYGAQILEHPELRELLLPVLRADYRLVDTYRAGAGMRLRTPVTALAGDADPSCTAEEVRAWSAATSAPFDMRTFPGDHFFLVPHRGEVVALVRERLAPLWRTGGEAGASGSAGSSGSGA